MLSVGLGRRSLGVQGGQISAERGSDHDQLCSKTTNKHHDVNKHRELQLHPSEPWLLSILFHPSDEINESDTHTASLVKKNTAPQSKQSETFAARSLILFSARKHSCEQIPAVTSSSSFDSHQAPVCMYHT